jgi:aminopeptidase N
VTQTYDQAKKELTLNVRQEQKPDPESQYPQVGLFQTPVDIEIGTATNTRVERVQIEPKEEQSFKFTVDSEPLLVNFDYGGTLIKELSFEKDTGRLMYQLEHDQDVLGRVWALSQLASWAKRPNTSEASKVSISHGIEDRLANDTFWGVRFEAAAALGGFEGAKLSLALAAAKDKEARVRARAVTSLAMSKDVKFADTYAQLLTDQSYGVIRAAATALGQTKTSAAYDLLVKLTDQPSWRDTIRVSALTGLAELGDKRALELAFKYAQPPNRYGVRASALALLGNIGKDDPRTLPTVTAAVNEGLEHQNSQILNPAGNALVQLGDPRGVAVFEEALKKVGPASQFRGTLNNFLQRLKTKVNPVKPPPK